MADDLEHRQKIQRLDDQTINGLVQHGADLNQPYPIRFLFRGDKAKLKGLEEALIKQGYTPVQNTTGSDDELMVDLTTTLKSMQSHLIALSLYDLSKEHGVSFEGWAAVVSNGASI